MAKQPLLSDIDIQRRLGALPGWTRRGDAITKVFTFRGFPEAVAFVDTLVAPAEQMNHHPDIDVRYNKVIITLSTHDSGGLTLNDLSLAEKIDSVGGGA